MIATPIQIGDYEIPRYNGNDKFIGILDSIPMGGIGIVEQRYPKYVLVANMVLANGTDIGNTLTIGQMLIYGGSVLTEDRHVPKIVALCQAVETLKIEDITNITSEYTNEQIETLKTLKDFIRESAKINKLTIA